MVGCKDDKAVTYVNSEAGFDSIKIVNGVDRLRYLSHTYTEQGH
jgi:hypothetical protein